VLSAVVTLNRAGFANICQQFGKGSIRAISLVVAEPSLPLNRRKSCLPRAKLSLRQPPVVHIDAVR